MCFCAFVRWMCAHMCIQWNLFNTKLYGQFQNSMLTVLCVNSTYTMCMYISSECRDVTKFHGIREILC